MPRWEDVTSPREIYKCHWKCKYKPTAYVACETYIQTSCLYFADVACICSLFCILQKYSKDLDAAAERLLLLLFTFLFWCKLTTSKLLKRFTQSMNVQHIFESYHSAPLPLLSPQPPSWYESFSLSLSLSLLNEMELAIYLTSITFWWSISLQWKVK